MSLRDEQLARLRTQPFDLLVVGGGIVGAGLARDASMRGLRVALVEQGDFAGGTSSKTSKLIHGGLRYLEHGHVRLVSESLRERHVLRTIAPHLVWPLWLTLPVYKGGVRSAWKIRAGLALYDLLAGQRNIRAHRVLSSRRLMAAEPRLNRGALRLAAQYTDCQMDDARLCLANILQAVSFGAVCANYVRVLGFTRAQGRLCGASLEDTRSGQVFEASAAVLVNATGPWSDAIRRMSDRQAGTRLAPTKGIHLVVPRLTQHGVFFQAKADGRMVFLLPYGEDYSLVGTTETPVRGSLDALHATPEEVQYLMDEVNGIIPDAGLEAPDIVAAFAGARPLLAFTGSPTRASREHQFEVDRYGLVSLMGGKFTTYRAMARQALDMIAERFDLRADQCLTDQVALYDAVHPVVLHRWQDLAQRIAPELLARLLAAYGTGAFRILELLEFEPALRQPVCPHHDVIQAELAYMLRDEMACTISDLLFRRTRIAYSACQGLDMLSALTDLLHRYGRLPRERVLEQVEQYHRQLADSLSFRAAFNGEPRSSLYAGVA